MQQPLSRRKKEIYASYRQFYVVDPDAGAHAGDVWDGTALERHVGAAPGLVAVGTIGNSVLPVTLEVWGEEPLLDLDDWDHVAEASLDTRSGMIGLAGVEGPEEDAPLFVGAGMYRLRIAGAGLATADDDGGDDWRVQLWPAPAGETTVRKWWRPWDPAGVQPQPTTSGGRLLVGAAAEGARRTMHGLAARGTAFLYGDSDGSLWEHSYLPTASGTPQLEQLDEEEAERRYGPRSEWGRSLRSLRPGLAEGVRNVWRTWRSGRGRRT